jgi:tRNA (guanine-N7-)-methyltransferase
MDAIVFPDTWNESNAPIEVDMGSHKGTFLVAMAKMYPHHRFLGVERQASRVERCQKKIERAGLLNAFTVQAEGLAVLRDLGLKAAVIHVSFPDPWPKRRHWTKRLVNDRFLRDAWNCLEPQGVLRLMTDDAAYFNAMEIAATACDGFVAVEWDDGREYPPTEFQMKFEFLPVHRLALRRCDSMSSE